MSAEAGDRKATEPPFSTGWRVTNGAAEVVVWTYETVKEGTDEAGQPTGAPVATFTAREAREFANTLGDTAEQAEIVAVLLPLVREAGGDAQQFSTALTRALSTSATSKALAKLGSAFGSPGLGGLFG